MGGAIAQYIESVGGGIAQYIESVGGAIAQYIIHRVSGWRYCAIPGAHEGRRPKERPTTHSSSRTMCSAE